MVSKEKAKRLKKKLERLLDPNLEFNLKEFTELVGGEKYYKSVMIGEKELNETPIFEIAHYLTKSVGRFGSSGYKVNGRNYKHDLWNWQCKNLSLLKDYFIDSIKDNSVVTGS
ncbi:MAG: hypothetical protein QF567_02800 [Candidatus Pacearchaeota archaeon]|jgi:hypothetical protein|nr:hypothetical protein [Candidatus Pacearchaeota archaeon]MDP7521137.1 hypothetical protein [Candidatus Pacearchaeota archaeon]|tara:strand:- start:145 stop:483 length:339 start_codon:yes stop_codon:yes gene_type:complete